MGTPNLRGEDRMRTVADATTMARRAAADEVRTACDIVTKHLGEYGQLSIDNVRRHLIDNRVHSDDTISDALTWLIMHDRVRLDENRHLHLID